MTNPKVVGWFDDRFYKCDLTKQAVDKILKRTKQISDYEYTVLNDGKTIFLPSSTTILGSAPKEWLAKWRGQVGNWEADRIMNEAMDKGSRIHHTFANLINGTIVLFNNPKAPTYTQEQISQIAVENKAGVIVVQDQQEMLELWRLKQFFDILKPKVVATEMTVVNERYGYAGTLDHLWHIEKGVYDLGDKVKYEFPETGLYILDIKTGGEDKINYPEQLASYYSAVIEQPETNIKGAVLLYSNSGNVKGIQGFKLDLLTPAVLEYHFQGFIYQYNVWLKKANKSPKVFDLPSLLRLN